MKKHSLLVVCVLLFVALSNLDAKELFYTLKPVNDRGVDYMMHCDWIKGNVVMSQTRLTKEEAREICLGNKDGAKQYDASGKFEVNYKFCYVIKVENDQLIEIKMNSTHTLEIDDSDMPPEVEETLFEG